MVKPYALLLLISLIGFTFACKQNQSNSLNAQENRTDSLLSETLTDTIPASTESASLDTALYNQKLLQLVHDKPSNHWPVRTEYPLNGALLPFNRIIAYYGNLFTPRMGILGSMPSDQMLLNLEEEVKNWQKADTTTPVIPALHYIAVTAQREPGRSSTYRLRMPFTEIDKVLALAKQIDALVFLDIQVGHSSLQKEIPELHEYLLLPHVHLGIDPEYSMKGGEVPSSRVGTFNASDINYAAGYLEALVKENNLPPKILIVHRFTKGMVTGYKEIMTRPEVQIVMNMDGFGFPAKKISTYKYCIVNEPVQFAGFKIFYKNDVENPMWPLPMQPEEILTLSPQPVYIQYQ